MPYFVGVVCPEPGIVSDFMAGLIMTEGLVDTSRLMIEFRYFAKVASFGVEIQ